MALWVEARYLYHHPAKFVGHMHCGVGDMMALFYHVILQDHMT